jgi:hypothetical protein
MRIHDLPLPLSSTGDSFSHTREKSLKLYLKKERQSRTLPFSPAVLLDNIRRPGFTILLEKGVDLNFVVNTPAQARRQYMSTCRKTLHKAKTAFKKEHYRESLLLYKVASEEYGLADYLTRTIHTTNETKCSRCSVILLKILSIIRACELDLDVLEGEHTVLNMHRLEKCRLTVDVTTQDVLREISKDVREDENYNTS